MARAAVFAFSESGPQVMTHQAPMSRSSSCGRLLGADLHVLDDVVVPGLVVAQRAVDAVGDLAGELHRLGAAHGADVERQAVLHGPREGEEPGVLVELAVVGDHALVEEGAHDLVRLLDARERLDRLPVDAVLREHAEVAAGDDALRAAAGQLVEGGERLADERRLAEVDAGEVGPEADVLRLVRGGRVQEPEVLVPGLVGRVARVVPVLVGRLDVLERIGKRVVEQRRVAELHGCAPSSASISLSSSSRHDAVREVVVHPRQVLPPAVDDPQRVPGRDVLLRRVLGHERRVDLVDVVEAHDDVVLDALSLRRLLRREPEADHDSTSS